MQHRETGERRESAGKMKLDGGNSVCVFSWGIHDRWHFGDNNEHWKKKKTETLNDSNNSTTLTIETFIL